MSTRRLLTGLIMALWSVPLCAQSLKPSNDIPALEAAVAHDSNDAQLHYQLAIAYWSRKRFDDAERSLRVAVTIERRFAAAYLALRQLMTNDFRHMLATLQYRSRRLDAAIELYREALANDVGLFMAHMQLGRIHEERHMWSEAVERYRAAVATSPDDPSILLDLGIVLREAGRLAESETALTEAMTANGRDSRVPYHLGLTLQQEGKGSAARVAFNRFLSLAPSRYERQVNDAKQRLDSLPP